MRSSTSPHAVAFARLAELPLPGVRFGAVQEAPRRLASDIEALDALLRGGWPQGRISEISGPLSCGKTALAVASLAAVSRRGKSVAYIDTGDTLCPRSLATAGADLQRILWIRPPSLKDAMRCTELVLRGGGFALVLLDSGTNLPPPRLRSQIWPRLLHAAEKSHSALLVLTPQRLAGSFAALSLHLQPRRTRWHGAVWPLFDGFETSACLERNKLGAPCKQTALHFSVASILNSPLTGFDKHVLSNAEGLSLSGLAFPLILSSSKDDLPTKSNRRAKPA